MQRCQDIRALGHGLASSSSAYRSRAVSVLHHVAQLLPPSAEVLKAEARMLQLLAAGPRHSFSRLMLVGMDEIGGGCNFPDLRCLSQAARYQVVHSSVAFWAGWR